MTPGGFGRWIASTAAHFSKGKLKVKPDPEKTELHASIEPPLWVGVGERDISTDHGAVSLVARRAPLGELHSYDVDHFEPMVDPDASVIAADQIAFLAGLGLVPEQG